MNLARFRRHLLAWYRAHARDLPWRQTRQAYSIWLSEVMSQQTRVATVIPYYEKFLTLFPTVDALAAAPEAQLLAAWAGLGYYSRARNLQRAARDIVAQGGFPSTYEGIAALPGVGAYTAAAVASMAFDLPFAAVDGNVYRVIARLDADEADLSIADTRRRWAGRAQELLDRRSPAHWNQAMMELGALLCTPRHPQCHACPVAADCQGRELGIAPRLPVKSRKQRKELLQFSVAIINHKGRLLLLERAAGEKRLAGFWELPRVDQLAGFIEREQCGLVRHGITFNAMEVQVVLGRLEPNARLPANARWMPRAELETLAVTTLSRKALRKASKRIDHGLELP
jgi:A/G-specific adenine glycosylase